MVSPQICLWAKTSLVACLFGCALCSIGTASERNEKRKVDAKFEVVAWGKKQGFWGNVGRVFDAVVSHGSDFSVYEKRYKDLNFHWQEMKDKGIDPRKEDLYFGYIDWVEKNRLGIPTDHYVRFYVAARPKGDFTKHSKESLGKLTKDELAEYLEGLSLDELRWQLIYGADEDTLAAGLINVNEPTLLIALTNLDPPTLKLGLKRIDDPTLKLGLENIAADTLCNALEVMDEPTLARAMKIIDDDTYSVGRSGVSSARRKLMEKYRH